MNTEILLGAVAILWTVIVFLAGVSWGAKHPTVAAKVVADIQNVTKQ